MTARALGRRFPPINRKTERRKSRRRKAESKHIRRLSRSRFAYKISCFAQFGGKSANRTVAAEFGKTENFV